MDKNKVIEIIMGTLKEDRYIAGNVSSDQFLAMTVGSLKLDVPPLPSDKNFEKEYLTRRIKKKFKMQAQRCLILSDDFLRTDENTLAQLVDYCTDDNNHLPIP